MTRTDDIIDGRQGGAFGRSGSSARSILLDHPVGALALLCLLQIVFWTALPALVDVGPPRDVAEGFMWGREWVLLTYKHPQLPAWLLETSHLLTGSFRWPQFLLSQLMISATFVFVYLLASDMLGRTRALAAVLLLPSIYLFGWSGTQFNHDTAQMPFWAAIAWLLWRAGRGDGPGWWLALGVVAGVGIYAKFSTAMLIGFGGLWILYDARARAQLATPWPWLGLAIFISLVTPVAIELVRIDFLPFSYAAERDQWVLANRARLYYIGVQAAEMAGMFIVLGICGLLRKRRQPETAPALERRALVYLLWMGLGPAVLTMIASLFVGIGEAWGTPMYNLVGVVAIALLGRSLGASELRKLAICAAVFIIGVSTYYAASAWVGCNLLGKLQPVCWPARTISERAEAVWHEQVPGRLGIVAGDADLATLAGLNAKDKPSIFTDLNYRFAPWITPQRLREQGMLLIWRTGSNAPLQAADWIKDRPVKTVLLDWSLKARPISLSFVVVPPGTEPPDAFSTSSDNAESAPANAPKP